MIRFPAFIRGYFSTRGQYAKMGISEMINVFDAIGIVDRETQPGTTVSIRLGECVGRVLAEDIVADSDLPPFDRSQMDGFALRSSDTAKTPADLVIVGESAAGCGWHKMLNRGEAVRIMTGAPVPPGADAVQRLESAREISASPHDGLEKDAGAVRIHEPASKGQFIIPKGAEIKSGETVFSAGERVSPAMIAAMAAFGYSEVRVAAKPRVAILATGSEVVDVDKTPGKDQIRNSNSPMLAALSCKCGGEAQELPLVPDELAALSQTIAEAAYKNDILVITGGVSVGKYDLTKEALRDLGAEIFFERVKLKPGKPAVFARLGTTLVFGLPGNPVSAAVTFHLFVQHAIARIQGATNAGLQKGRAVAATKLKGAGERDTMLPALLETDESGCTTATPLKWLGSSDFIGFARANILIFVPAGKVYEAGEVVTTYTF